MGLDEGTYILRETAAPNGYNTAPDQTVVIEATTANNQTWAMAEANTALTGFKYTVNSDDAVVETEIDGIAKLYVINQGGTSLPSTGGIGTTIFYLSGGILVVGAGVSLIAKKRMKDAE
jgi:LPXTG-motif cell wall-anchored protein